jgi:hypothetical protein
MSVAPLSLLMRVEQSTLRGRELPDLTSSGPTAICYGSKFQLSGPPSGRELLLRNVCKQRPFSSRFYIDGNGAGRISAVLWGMKRW